MTVIGNPNNSNSGWDNVLAAMAAKKAKRGGAGRADAKKLDLHRFMTDDAYMIEMIGGQAVFDAFAKEVEAVIGTALDTEETE
tara:strand:+ start:88 stop:336 length:249 start_codon:yes stop_codon:yes gene_type:complete